MPCRGPHCPPTRPGARVDVQSLRDAVGATNAVAVAVLDAVSVGTRAATPTISACRLGHALVFRRRPECWSFKFGRATCSHDS